ncbi:hypothetical protein M9H77_22970 [Catharanthus roseus]|uniref:Uncharacterized protein n=1 Tax=Catharanthus roseus TaxID=4058 RepID=A0ACC0AUH7_CATRO|nr:hypothetical protein M9H77_22970 [Catharanthus roseus]
MAQVKDAMERANVVEGKLARLNTRKAKLDEIIAMGRPTGVNFATLVQIPITQQFEASHSAILRRHSAKEKSTIHRIEVVLLFNEVEDLQGFKLKQPHTKVES